jgi:thiamine-monophosphate kinase
MKSNHATLAFGRGTEDVLLEKVASLLGGKNQLPGAGVSLGIGDDAAIWRPRPGYEAILTCDWFLEGVHFLREKHPPDAVGWKCLARALSDVAAMGGLPRCFLLSLAVPETHLGAWLEKFLAGLHRASRRFRCYAAGGDTTRYQKILINVMAIGEIEGKHGVLRSGARAGDFIYVTGRLGEAELGLLGLRRSKNASRAPSAWLQKHLYPEPRLELGRWLASHRLATAMMDLSDGLSTDLPRLCAASGVGARIEEAQLPTARIRALTTLRGSELVRAALHGGDDYELLFTVPAGKARLLPSTIAGIPITKIGATTAKREILLLRKDGREEVLHPAGWDPFRKKRR